MPSTWEALADALAPSSPRPRRPHGLDALHRRRCRRAAARALAALLCATGNPGSVAGLACFAVAAVLAGFLFRG
jgi:hypothetical protein